MNKSLEERRRRAIYRAGHRGTKELDILLSKYARARVEGMEDDELREFEVLLEISDPLLQSWLVSLSPPTSKDNAREVAPVVDEVPRLVYDVRKYHGLD